MENKYTDVIYEVKGPTAYINLNRPEKLNALSMGPGELCDQIHDACLEAEADDKVRVIVIKGEGRAFSSGYDLVGSALGSLTGAEKAGAQAKEAGAKEAEDLSYIMNPKYRSLHRRRMEFHGNTPINTRRWVEAIWENEKPVIAQVHGYCLAGATDIIGFCDLAIASDDALFGYPPVRYVSAPVSTIWPYILGPKHSKYLLFTGAMITAQQACEQGMINEVVPFDKLEQRVKDIAQVISLIPWVSIYGSKALVNKQMEIMGIHTALSSSWEIGSLIHETEYEHTGFFKAIVEKGLKEALKERDAKFNFFDIKPEARARRYDQK